MSVTMPVRRSTDRIDARTQLYKRYVNTGILIFILLMVLFAGSGFAISTKVESHSQQISADRAILKFICEDMQNEDANREALHEAERKIQVADTLNTTPYWIALNRYFNKETVNSKVRQQKCAELAKDSR